MYIAIIGLAALAGDSQGDDPEAPNPDQLLIDAQQVCVVSGQPLDSNGGPIRTQAGGRTVFVCCRDCLGKDVPADIWAEVLVNWREAQGKCPVMDRALPANARSVVVEGRTVFVCCPPCIPRIQAEPARYLAIVDQFLAENLDGE